MNTTTATENGTEDRKITRLRRPEPGERERVVAEWAASGKSVEEVAALTGWSPYTLYRWRLDAGQGKRSKPKPAPSSQPKLVAVPRPTSLATGAWAAEVTVSPGVSVRLSSSCSPAWAGHLVRELKSC